MSGRWMRFAGWIFVLAGLSLCLSVAWATVGFLMMGVGLIALQAAERRRKHAATPTRAEPHAVSSFDAAPGPSFKVPSFDASRREPGLEEPVFASPPPVAPEPAHRGDVQIRQTFKAEPSFETIKVSETARWQTLVHEDPDISALVAVLAPHGATYVEQFAQAYLAVNDKTALPQIIDSIVARARMNAGIAEAMQARPQPAAVLPLPATSIASLEGPAAMGVAMESPVLRAEPAPEPATEIKSSANRGNLPAATRPYTPVERAAPVTSADDSLADLFERFSPDSGFLGGTPTR